MAKPSGFSLSLSFRHWSLRSSLITEQTLGINTSASVVSVAWNSLKWVCNKAHFSFLNSKCAYVLAKLLQLCLTLCDPMDCSLPGSSVHGILQARILEPVALPSSRGPSWPRNQTPISCSSYSAGRFFTAEPPGNPFKLYTWGLNTTICLEIIKSWLWQYWAYLVAQLVKNMPAMWETWVQSLSWEDPLEKGMATHSSILA